MRHLQHGTREMPLLVAYAQAYEASAGVRIGMRGSFTGKVGQKNQPFGARRNGLGKRVSES